MPDLLDAAADKPLKILQLTVENVKRIKVLSITPDGNMVLLAGPNGSGKTSTMDSLWWGLKGAGVIQSAPIREGQEEATIKIGLGENDTTELIVTRTFRRIEGDEFTTSVSVVTADGVKISKPQTFLDKISGPGGIAFDPVLFARDKPKGQFETLRQFVPGVDFARIDGLNTADKERRTAINREADEKRAQAAGIAIPEATPKARIDETAIVTEIAEVGEFNAQIERRKEGRALVAKEAADFRTAAASARERAEELRRQADALDQQAKVNDDAATEREDRLAKAEPLPEPKDAAAVRAKLDEAKRINAAVDQALRRETLLAEVRDLEQQSEALTAKIAARNEEKHAAISAAKMPVEGLGFGDDCITFNGVPFDQASAAEQLRVSVAIAMAANPRLKLVLIRDGSLLDKASMKLVAEMATAKDCGVWVEKVDDSGEDGIVFEEGAIASTPATRAGRRKAAPTAQAAE